MKDLDPTPLYHACLASLALIAIGLSLYSFVGVPSAVTIGGAFGIGFYFGREVAQAEARKPKAHDGKWWRGFDISLWNTASILDLVVPIAVCSIFIVIGWL